MALPLFIYELLNEDHRRNHMRIVRRNLRDQQNPFEIPDDIFIGYFRLPKQLIRSIIQVYSNVGRRRTKIPFHLKVLVTLYFLENGSYQNPVGSFNLISMSQSMVSICIGEICRLITRHLMPIWINFPTAVRERTVVKQRFYTKWNMRGIIGAIDGTHVDIIAPPVTDINYPSFVYMNRKGVHSINVMLICDSDNKIMGANARFLGSVHDSAIWQMDNIRAYLRNEYERGNMDSSFLIGDSGYALEPWLMTPYANYIEGTSEGIFNQKLKSSRNVIERTNGILKGRFRCLSRHRVLNYHPSKAAYIIYACTVLHNMAIEAKLEPPDIEEQDENLDDDAINDFQPDANILRNARGIRDMYVLQNM